MKTQTGLKQKMLLVTMTIVSISMSIGCASKKDGGGDTAGGGTAVVTPTVVGAEANIYGLTGEIGTINSIDRANFTTYASTHPLNNPKNPQIGVKLFKAGDVSGNGGYAGTVQIAYEDNGQIYIGRFSTADALTPTGSNAGTIYRGWHHAAYNKWFTDKTTGKRVFHGFFEDEYGAVMLVVEDAVDQGDGAGASQLTGSIWFKNYYNNPFPRYQTKDVLPCWFITAGGYDCRTFLEKVGSNKDGNIVTDSALLPPDSKYAPGADTHPYHQGVDAGPARGWRKLGTFNGLDVVKAFDN